MGKEFDENVNMVKAYVSNIKKNYKNIKDDIEEDSADIVCSF